MPCFCNAWLRAIHHLTMPLDVLDSKFEVPRPKTLQNWRLQTIIFQNHWPSATISWWFNQPRPTLRWAAPRNLPLGSFDVPLALGADDILVAYEILSPTFLLVQPQLRFFSLGPQFTSKVCCFHWNSLDLFLSKQPRDSHPPSPPFAARSPHGLTQRIALLDGWISIATHQ